MNENKIYLNFPKTLTRISGNDYGKHIYETQIKSKISEDEKNVIVIPSYIEGIGISFVQGLIGEFIKKYGKDKLYKYVEFSSDKTDIVDSIKESIEF